MFENYTLIKDINDIFNKPYTLIELLLNIFFLLIIFIISYIFYWDIINTNAIKNSHCNANISALNTKGGYYYVYANDSQNNKLFNIQYDKTNNEPNAVCACNPGTYINKFEGIKLYDINNKQITSTNLQCSCDKVYHNPVVDSPNDYYYSGEPFLLKFMYDNNPYTGVGCEKENCYTQPSGNYHEPQFPNI